MADIRSRPSTDTYREGWDRVFGKPRRYVPPAEAKCAFCGWMVPLNAPTCPKCWPDLVSHPAAD